MSQVMIGYDIRNAIHRVRYATPNESGASDELQAMTALVEKVTDWSFVCHWMASDITSALSILVKNGRLDSAEGMLLGLKKANVSLKKIMFKENISYPIIEKSFLSSLLTDESISDHVFFMHLPFAVKHLGGSVISDMRTPRDNLMAMAIRGLKKTATEAIAEACRAAGRPIDSTLLLNEACQQYEPAVRLGGASDKGERSYACVQLLLEWGADGNGGAIGNRPLVSAMRAFDKDGGRLIRDLVNAGANLDVSADGAVGGISVRDWVSTKAAHLSGGLCEADRLVRQRDDLEALNQAIIPEQAPAKSAGARRM